MTRWRLVSTLAEIFPQKSSSPGNSWRPQLRIAELLVHNDICDALFQTEEKGSLHICDQVGFLGHSLPKVFHLLRCTAKCILLFYAVLYFPTGLQLPFQNTSKFGYLWQSLYLTISRWNFNALYVIRNNIFWDVTRCNAVVQRFRGTHCLHFQGWRVRQARGRRQP
jgi:hypothetical protein